MAERWSYRWEKIRALILERDHWTCQLEYPGCQGHATQVDHIVPRRYGGDDNPGNLRAACARCNRRRGDGVTPVSRVPVSAW